ncbi:MAG: DUF4422 domain-containing protein [Oscillospiraceae bacterium]|nr:DUF4422 domain-containing protein [Oscillospiraceae bacterium]
MIDRLMITEIIQKYSKFAFYGAQVVAYGAYTAIKHLSSRSPECFIVSNLDGNPREIEGLPVQALETVSPDTLIIIAVTELLQDEIAANLKANGYLRTFKLTSHEEHLLMSDYYASIGKFPLAMKKPGGDIEFTLFEVRHHLDKPLKKRPKLEPWETSIQAGAELTDIRICGIPDNTGDNISIKNKQYSEASAMYWVWKNASAPWVGIEHYRRHLLVSPEMLNDNADAILTLPYICYPNAKSQFQRFVSEDIIAVLLTVLNMLYPDDYDDYVRCLNGKYFYTSNLISAKHGVFADYCKWAFGIMERIEQFDMQSIKKPRALGYIVEMLTSIYFMSNKQALNIRHAQKAIYR